MRERSTGPIVRFADLTYLEIRRRAEAGWLAVVPTGCTEQQGPHLPVAFDTWFAETLCEAAGERATQGHATPSLVLPAIPFGPTSEHRNYGAGYIDVPVELHGALVHAVLASLIEQAFRKIVVWRGCGGHRLEGTIERFNRAHAGKARAFLPAQPFHAIWRRVGEVSVPGGHADSFATSIALHLRPEAVRTDLIPDRDGGDVDWTAADLDFSRYSRTGVIGDPTHASVELGARLWEAAVEEVALLLRDAAAAPV